MLSSRVQWLWFLTLLLAACGVRAGAQTPSSIIVLRLTEYQQTSATQETVSRYDFAAYVDFASPPSTAVTVTMKGPNGSTLSFSRQDDGSYQSINSAATAEQLRASYPDGTYVISVTGGGSNSSTTVNVNTNATLTPTLITNYDQLQKLPSLGATVTWSGIVGASYDDVLTLSMTKPDGTDVAASDPSTALMTSVTEVIPQGVPITADLTYAKLLVTSQLNNGATNFASGAGFNVEFPIYYPAPVPQIVTPPVALALAAGSAGSLRVTMSGNPTFQWYKDGVVVPGATASILAVHGVVAEAGAYTVTGSNLSGSVTSDPVQVAVGAGAQVAGFAGTGMAGSQDGPIGSAQFKGPSQMAFDQHGNLYVLDSDNDAIRKIAPDGMVTTMAGQSGVAGSADGVGAAARFNQPGGIAVDASGTLYVADSGNDTIRKITPDGVVTTLAGTAGTRGSVDGVGTAARFSLPTGIAVDAVGNVYVNDGGNALIRKITPAGVVSTIIKFGNTADFWAPRPLVIGPDGDLYIIVTNLYRIALGGSAATAVQVSDPAFFFSVPTAMAFDASGNLYVADFGLLRRMSPDGLVETVAGQRGTTSFADGFGVQAGFGTVYGLAVAPSGALYISDYDHNVIRQAAMVAGTGPGVVFVQQPQSHLVAAGSTFALNANVATGAPAGNWEKDGVAVTGSNYSPLMITSAKSSDAGTYAFVVTNDAGAVRSRPATITVAPNAAPSRITNLSIRSAAGTGAQTLIVGFAVSGSGTAKRVLLRAVGPGLAPFGVSTPLADPLLTVFQNSAAIQSNDNWAPELAPDFAAVSAFPLAAGSTDAAMEATFAVGSYTAQITGKDGTGMALGELYDLESADSGLRLVNVSARTQVGTGDNVLIAGFAITGDTSKTVLVRGVGPTLANFGLPFSTCLADPEIELYSGNTKIAGNDKWPSGIISVAARNVGAFSLSESSNDAAMLITLDPGTYSVVLRGKNDSTGVGLVEVYEVP